MSATQPEMRETTAELREPAPAAAHASRTAGAPWSLWSRTWARVLAFAVGTGLFLSAVGAFDTGRLPWALRTAGFLALSVYAGFLGWGLAVWTCRLPWARGRPWRRGAIVAAAMTLIMGATVWLLIAAVSGGRAAAPLPQYVLLSLVPGVTATALSFALFRRPGVTHAAPAGAPPPRLLARLPAHLRGAEVWAVEAEDHYLRVRTSRGEALLLLRLRDAMAELEGLEGARTHRSWWVARAAVTSVERGDGRATLTLPDGARAPVSRTYARALREAGWL